MIKFATSRLFLNLLIIWELEFFKKKMELQNNMNNFMIIQNLLLIVG